MYIFFSIPILCSHSSSLLLYLSPEFLAPATFFPLPSYSLLPTSFLLFTCHQPASPYHQLPLLFLLHAICHLPTYPLPFHLPHSIFHLPPTTLPSSQLPATLPIPSNSQPFPPSLPLPKQSPLVETDAIHHRIFHPRGEQVGAR